MSAPKRYAIVNPSGHIVRLGIPNRARGQIELEDYGPGHRLVRDRSTT